MTLDIYNFFIYQHVLQMRGSCTVTSELSSCQFFCLPDCLSVCLSVCRAVCLSGCISFCLSVRLFSQFSVYICQSSCMLFLSLPVCPLVRIGLSKDERHKHKMQTGSSRFFMHNNSICSGGRRPLQPLQHHLCWNLSGNTFTTKCAPVCTRNFSQYLPKLRMSFVSIKGYYHEQYSSSRSAAVPTASYPPTTTSRHR